MSELRFYDLHPPAADLRREVLTGLGGDPRAISPKFFYDRRGSHLFEAITDTPEYYPTRTEIGILERCSGEIAELLGERCLLVELGSGSSRKIRLLLDRLQPAAYVPVDISRDFLREAAGELADEYPAVEIHATCADYSRPLELPYCPEHLPRAAFFPGSSIGNFEPAAAERLLANVARSLGPRGRLIVGVDLQKPAALLDAAYNDAEGLTAEFNRNLLRRINRELGADFDADAFEHEAFYNSVAGRVEMHLVSSTAQRVRVDGHSFDFAPGEGIHTENSYKYTVAGFHALAARAGFRAEKVWTDPEQLFSVHCLKVA